MAQIVSVSCDKCGGVGHIDAYYDGEKQEWVTRICPKCSGSGSMYLYQYDDGTYSDPW